MLSFRTVDSILPYKMSRPEPVESIDMLYLNQFDLYNSLAQYNIFIDKYY